MKPITPLAVAPLAKAKRRGKSGQCRIRRMGRAGSRCFCNGKLVKTSRCR